MVDPVDTPLISGGLDTIDSGPFSSEQDEEELRRSSGASGDSPTNRISPSNEVTQIEVTLPAEISTETQALDNNENDRPDGPNSIRQKLVYPPTSWDKVHKYKMDRRGYFVIFNQKNFSRVKVKQKGSNNDFDIVKLPTREGTDKDRDSLMSTATKLGFKDELIKVFPDLPRKKIFTEMKKISGADRSDYDCFVCCILTHGDEGDILYAQDEAFKLTQLIEMFRPDKCPSLAGKPKLFFIQACRGKKLDNGHWLESKTFDTVDGPSNDKENSKCKIPLESDFLIAQPTVKDYYSWRNSANGSTFIQSLCQCLDQWGRSKEIMQILTQVNHMVAYDFESNSKPEMSGKKQMPSITTRLTSELYFGYEVESEPNQPSSSHVQVGQTPSDIEPVEASFDQETSLDNIANAVRDVHIDLEALSSQLDALNSKDKEIQGNVTRNTYCVIL